MGINISFEKAPFRDGDEHPLWTSIRWHHDEGNIMEVLFGPGSYASGGWALLHEDWIETHPTEDDYFRPKKEHLAACAANVLAWPPDDEPDLHWQTTAKLLWLLALMVEEDDERQYWILIT